MSRFSMICLFLGLFIPYMVYASQCGPNATFSDCASACDPTCGNPNPQGISCVQVCEKRCRCKSQYLRKGNQCVLSGDC